MQKKLTTMILLGMIASANGAPVGNQGIYTDQDLIVVQMSLSSSKVLRDTPVTVTWRALADAPSCTIKGVPEGEVSGAGEGSYTFAAQASTRITVTCDGTLHQVSASRSLYVAPDGTRPEVSAYFTPNRIVAGSTTNLSCSSYYADECHGDAAEISGTYGSSSFYFGSKGNVTRTVECTNRFGSTKVQATVAVMPNPPWVMISTYPSSLMSPGYVWVYVDQQRATKCSRPLTSTEMIRFTQDLWVTCWNEDGSASSGTTVTVGNPGITAESTKNHDDKAAQNNAPDLSHVGLDLRQDGMHFVVLDLNSDQQQDVMVLDTHRKQLHLVLAEKGRYNRIHHTFENVSSFDDVDMVYIEKNAAQNAHLRLKAKQ